MSLYVLAPGGAALQATLSFLFFSHVVIVSSVFLTNQYLII